MDCEMTAGALVMDGVTEGRMEVERARGRVVSMRRDMAVVVYVNVGVVVEVVESFAVFKCVI